MQLHKSPTIKLNKNITDIIQNVYPNQIEIVIDKKETGTSFAFRYMKFARTFNRNVMLLEYNK